MLDLKLKNKTDSGRKYQFIKIDKALKYKYLGPEDYIIKSRGYRIEIGEIESAIYGHPEIIEVAVVAIPDDLITNRIKPFIVVKNGK